MATPCIDGTPAGAARQADVLWSGLNLLVDGASSAKLARRVPEELGKVFDRADIRGALAYSFERSVGDVCAYLEDNFKLAERIAPAGEELGEEDGEGTQRTEGGTKGGSADNATGEAGPDQEEKPDDDKANEQDLEDEVEG